MAGAAIRRSTGGAAPGWGASILAGAAAGAVAAIAGVGTEIALRSPLPPHLATVWSAFVAGILGGILYGVLGRLTRSPAPALWAVTLLIATVDSALIWAVPIASGRSPSSGVPIVGLLAPMRQLLALAGIGHLGTRHFPARCIAAATVTHYTTPLAVSLLFPWWAGPRNR
jgi:hypothetical protein